MAFVDSYLPDAKGKRLLLSLVQLSSALAQQCPEFVSGSSAMDRVGATVAAAPVNFQT